MSNINRMIKDLIDVSYRLADEKDYDDKIAPALERIISHLKLAEKYTKRRAK